MVFIFDGVSNKKNKGEQEEHSRQEICFLNKFAALK
jgi:hypothetical protein